MFTVTTVVRPGDTQLVNLDLSAYRLMTEDEVGVEFTVEDLAAIVASLTGRDLTLLGESLQAQSPTAARVLAGAL